MRIAICLLALCACFFPAGARSAIICATSSAGLEFALAAAEGNGETDEIRLTEGAFDAPAGGFEYQAAASENFDLTISGGWSEFFGNPCGQQLEGAPATTINGQFLERGLEIRMRDSGILRVSRLSFINGLVPDPFRGAGLWVRAEEGFSGAVFIERNLFFNNEAESSGGLHVGITGSGSVQLHLLNNVFRLNRARQTAGAGTLLLNGGNASLLGARVVALNNTVVSNLVDATGPDVTGGLDIRGQVPAKWVVNNNLWGNEGLDLLVKVSLSTTFALYNNNYEDSQFTQPPTAQDGNISVQPAYENCEGFLCFSGVPLPGTPLHDGGREPGMISPWFPGPVDYRGLPRSNGARVDIGAFESHALLFRDRFEVQQ
ncbi:MAG: hypothetical protein GVY32_05300 [Gammaproteobacteria bacterium]|jgi:hypothetical protein|nr:hypothetical protein [Gammaproteobacteria bacterium]